MTARLHVAIPPPPSVGTTSAIAVGTDHVPRFQPSNLGDLDEKHLFEGSVREYCPSSASQDGDDNDVTAYQDGQFPATSGREKLPASLPSKIVSETRKKFLDAVRLGSNDEGIETLERGLETLRESSIGASDSWRLGEAEILLDLGRKAEARKALAYFDTKPRSRGSDNPARRPALSKSSSDLDAKFEAEMLKFNNQNAQENLVEVSLRAEDWVKAAEAAEKLHCIDSSFFNIQTKMDRYRKCRQILILGGLEETRSPGADFGKALRFYNHGCFATELFHKHFDPPRAQVNGLDHNDSANLFFSAARVCVLFHQHGVFDEQVISMTPEQFTSHFKDDPIPCSPPLAEQDWMHQAFRFMEQGRSRALFESIIGGDPEKPLVTAIQRKYLMADVAMVARETIRIGKKKDSYLLPVDTRSGASSGSLNHKNSSEPSVLLGIKGNTPPTSYVMDTELGMLPQGKTRSLALAPLLDTANLDDYRYPELVSSPSSLEDSELGSTMKEKAQAKSRAQLRWQKAFLYALATCNPTSILAKIPPDTAAIEYALVTAPPEGLISIVATSDGIEDCVWQKLDTVKLQNDVADLLSLMQSENVGVHNRSPTSPRKRENLNADELRKRLSSILLQPIEARLSGKRKLIIIPSGELAHVPWAMLLQLPFTIIPSLSIWDHLESHSRESQAPFKVSVLGNSPRKPDGSLNDGDIPYSFVEAFYVARLYDGFPFLAGENNQKQFQQWVSKTKVLHLCAHSTFDNQDPARSGIQLSNDPLTIHDWRDLAIKADLVIFSSCLSGISKAFSSGSAFGFAHALLGTGTRAFVGSLWPVDDLATLLLMMIFYEQLRFFSPAEALYNAQMKMRDLSQNDVWALMELLKINLDHPSVEKYVDNHEHWIWRLDNMSAEEVQSLHEPRCWAAFVLTGYGFQKI